MGRAGCNGPPPRPVPMSGRSLVVTPPTLFLTHFATKEVAGCVILAALNSPVLDVGGRTSKGEAELQRCLMPLEVFEIEGGRIVRRSPRDLDIPCKQYPRALGQVGIYCWPNKKAVAREVVET